MPNNPAKKLKETRVEYRIGSTLQPEQREMVRCACENEFELALCDMLYVTGIRYLSYAEWILQMWTFIVKLLLFMEREERTASMFKWTSGIALWRYIDSRNDDNPALFVSPHRLKAA